MDNIGWILLARKQGVWIELEDEFNKEYLRKIVHYIKAQKDLGKIIYPKEIFNAYKLCSYLNTKVVVLFKEPYGNEYDEGICLSAKVETKYIHILQEALNKQYPLSFPPKDSSLLPWAKQGVLLLNSSLTVEANNPESHSNIGWDNFINATIFQLNKKPAVAYILIGAKARSFKSLINNNHLVIQLDYFSNNWDSMNCFIYVNDYLVKNKLKQINWNDNT